jgi:putative ABC transport system permease protein
MLRLSLKQVLAHRFRLGLTFAAVVLGVAFVTGSLVLTDTSQRLFDDQFATATSGVDVTVTSAVAFDSAMGIQVDRDPVPANVLDQVTAVDGVASAHPAVIGSGLLVNAGKPIVPAGPSTLTAWTDGPANPYRLRTGHAPQRPGDVVIDAATAKQHHLKIGDPVRIQSKTTAPLTITGTAGFGEQDGVPNSTVALVTTTQAQQLLDLHGTYTSIEVVADDNASTTRLREDLAASLGAKYSATSARDTAEAGVAAAKDRLGYLRLMLSIMAGAALLIGAVLIANTFSIVVSQRTRELAVLRAAGATSRQVFTMVFGEALLIGVLGSAVGVAAGVGSALVLRDLVGTFGVAVPDGSVTVLPSSLLLGFMIGVAVTVIAATGPSRRAGRVAPLQALRDSATEEPRSLVRIVLGHAFAQAAVFGPVIVVWSGADSGWLVFGAVSAVVALVLLGPSMTRWMMHASTRFTRRLGVSSHLASEFAARSPRRTAATVLALALSLGLIAFIAVLASSSRSGVADTYREAVTADYVVESARAEMLGGLAPSVYENLKHVAEVRTVSATRFGHWMDGTTTNALTAVDPDTINDVTDLKMTAGSMGDLHRGGIILAEHVGTDRDLEVGDKMAMEFARVGKKHLPIVGFLDDRDAQALSTDYVIGQDTYDQLFTERMDGSVYVDVTGDPADARYALEKAIADFPTADLRDEAAAIEGRSATIDQILGLVTVLLMFTVLMAALGITNTMALSVLERTRQLGLLRAVGMVRGQLRAMVRTEAVLIALFAVAVGISVGALYASAMVNVLGHDAEVPTDVPVLRLAATAAVAVLAGLAASLAPARRAARLDVLDAIRT